LLNATLPDSVKKKASSRFLLSLILGIGYLLSDRCVFRGDFQGFFALCPVFTRRVGQLLYPRGESGTQGRRWLLLVFTVVVCTVTEVYFQLQNGISQVPQRLLEFRFSTAEETKQYRCDTSVTAL
jgi:hypothetical protein